MDNKENAIEFLSGDDMMVVSFTSKKFVNLITNLYKEHPDQFTYFYQNDDGSICAKIPLSWEKIRPPRTMTEEQKEAARERMKALWMDEEFREKMMKRWLKIMEEEGEEENEED